MDVIHTAIWISDLDQTEQFYCDGLGLNRNWEYTAGDGVQNVYIGGEHGEIQFKYDPDGDRNPSQDGLAHIAISVESTDDVFERVTERTNCSVVEAPTTMDEINRRVAFIEDPDGYEIELVERLS